MQKGKLRPSRVRFRLSSPHLLKINMRPPSPSIPEKEFLFSALKESQRLDGRLPLEMRTPVLTFGPDLGWVECAFGKTRFVIGHFLYAINASRIVFLILD
jgi:hypothetical protein